jgi:hypothetical protein
MTKRENEGTPGVHLSIKEPAGQSFGCTPVHPLHVPPYARAGWGNTAGSTPGYTQTTSHQRLTERVCLQECFRCTQLILRALTDGLDTRVDPTPIDLHTELQAINAGRLSYNIITTQQHLELAWRSPIQIRANKTAPVVTTHLCPDGHRPIGGSTTGLIPITTRPPMPATPTHPPF